MSNLELSNLVTNSQAFLMYKEPGLTATQAIEKLQKLAADNQAVPPVTHPEYSFWQAFSNSTIPQEAFNQEQANFAVAKRVELCKQLSILKFNDEERFALLMQKSDEQVKDILFVIDPMKNFIINMGRNMVEHEHTLQEAIDKSFQESYIANIYLIKPHHTNCLLSAEVKSQLYWHARIGLILGEDSFKGHPEEQYLRPFATFHLAHPEKLFRQLDLELKKLGFSIKECLELVNIYVNNIESLKVKIEKMKNLLTIIEQVMEVNKDKGMTYNQARSAILSSEYNDKDRLTEADYGQLLSQRRKNGFMAGRYNSAAFPLFMQNPIRQSAVARSLGTTSSATFPALDHTNLELMAGAGVGVLCLILLARFRHNKLLAAPFSLIKFGGKKILGCFYNPDSSSGTSVEILVDQSRLTNVQTR